MVDTFLDMATDTLVPVLSGTHSRARRSSAAEKNVACKVVLDSKFYNYSYIVYGILGSSHAKIILTCDTQISYSS